MRGENKVPLIDLLQTGPAISRNQSNISGDPAELLHAKINRQVGVVTRSTFDGR